jgi:hypothetical protein
MAKRPTPKIRALSFVAYARQHPGEHSQAGFFIADVKRDKTFPDVTGWSELRSYLNRTGAAHAKVVAARLAWRKYQNFLRGRSNA